MRKLKYGLFFISTAFLFVFFACKKKSNNQTAASNATISLATSTPVNVTIFVSSHPEIGSWPGYLYVAGGISGIILYRTSQTQFYAYERACTYDGTTNKKALCWMQPGNFNCRDSICGSTYLVADGTGSITHGPASYGLKLYTVNYDGTNVVHITN